MLGGNVEMGNEVDLFSDFTRIELKPFELVELSDSNVMVFIRIKMFCSAEEASCSRKAGQLSSPVGDGVVRGDV